MAGNIGDDRRHRPTGQRLLGRPQQLDHIGWPDQHHCIGIEPENGQPRTIGQAHFLGFGQHLQIDHRPPDGGQKAARLPQRKAQQRPAIAPLIAKHFLHQAGRGHGKAARPGSATPEGALGTARRSILAMLARNAASRSCLTRLLMEPTCCSYQNK